MFFKLESISDTFFSRSAFKAFNEATSEALHDPEKEVMLSASIAKSGSELEGELLTLEITKLNQLMF